MDKVPRLRIVILGGLLLSAVTKMLCSLTFHDSLSQMHTDMASQSGSSLTLRHLSSHPHCSKFTFPVQMHPSPRNRILLPSAVGWILHNAQCSRGAQGHAYRSACVSLPRKMELKCFGFFTIRFQEMLWWLCRPNPFPYPLECPLCSPT